MSIEFLWQCIRENIDDYCRFTHEKKKKHDNFPAVTVTVVGDRKTGTGLGTNKIAALSPCPFGEKGK